MNKIFACAMSAALALPLVAQEAAAPATKPAEAAPAVQSADSAVWPAFFALGEYPASPDVIGVRITVPYSTRQENVTGFDLGLWGRATYFEGLQANILRNDVADGMAGIQVGLYNSLGHGEMIGVQVGLWNEAGCLRGVQGGLVNVAGSAEGFQIGLINRCETMYGFQVGLVNVIRDAELVFCPVVNVGF